MPTILAVDTSATPVSCAILQDDRLVASYYAHIKSTHSQTLMPMIEHALRLCQLTMNDVDALAVNNGPGSFTGVRIGAATLKGLAFAKQKPCLGVSTLEAIAYNLQGFNGIICPVMNARRKQVYTAIFRQKNGVFERLLPDSAISIAELDEQLATYHEPIYLCGDGYDVTVKDLKTPICSTPERLRHQSAYSVAQIAYGLYQNGVRTTDAEMAPTYLRPCQAERERAEREKLKQETK